jgi:heterodisulfide reductase subunit B
MSMQRISYYPGCALKERSSHLDASARIAMEKLGIELDEIDQWTCCGAVPPASEERIMNLVAPVRILRKLRDAGETSMVTICDFCYNVLKRANYRMRNDEIKRKRVNAFLKDDDPKRDYLPSEDYEQPEYSGEVKVYHLMEYLRDVIGYDSIRESLPSPLSGLKVAPYYGCIMLRPREEIGLDSPENPSIIEGFIESLGAEPVKYPYRTECCGSYLSVSDPEVSMKVTRRIIRSALDRGAEAMVLSCPLCFYNLETRQKAVAEAWPEFTGIPVFYFTQLLALALGLPSDDLGFDRHGADVTPVLHTISEITGTEVKS